MLVVGAGDRIGEAPASAEVFQQVAESVEVGDHLGSGGGEGVHVVPFGNDGVVAVAGLDDAGAPQAGPVGADALMLVQEILVASRFHSDPHGVDRGHGVAPPVADGSADL